MTLDQMAELAARLHKQAQIHRQHFKTADQLEWADTIDTAADLIAGMAQRNEPLMKLIEYADLADDSCYGTVSSRVVRDLANEALGIRQEDAA